MADAADGVRAKAEMPGEVLYGAMAKAGMPLAFDERLQDGPLAG